MQHVLHTYRNLAPEIFAFRQAVKQMAADRDADSEVVVAALADVLADIAALLDKQGGSYSLPERMQAFCQRVEETYTKMRNTMEKEKVTR